MMPEICIERVNFVQVSSTISSSTTLGLKKLDGDPYEDNVNVVNC